jgi:organic radical activating enzyme
MTITDIRKKVMAWRRKRPASQVVITGGEPLEQDLGELVGQLKQEGFFLAIETNGCHFQNLDIDWWTVSPKDGQNFSVNPHLRPQISEVKLIVNKNLKLDVIKKIRDIKRDFPIFLQPQFFDPDKYEKAYRLYQRCQELGLPGIRIGFQMHTIYGKK